jgi:hypothetical protein
MSGGQTPWCDSDKQLKYISNFISATTCRYHMPYVVAYVVPDVVAMPLRHPCAVPPSNVKTNTNFAARLEMQGSTKSLGFLPTTRNR